MEDFKQYAALAAKGDTEAFSRLYEMVYKDLYHIALYCLRTVSYTHLRAHETF